MIDISRSQSGAKATWEGLDYQKRIVAYLAIKMLSEGHQIIRITCEELDDIKVEEETKIIYYQVKLTSSPSLSSTEIHNSIKLFSLIEANNPHNKRTEYVLISNAKIMRLPDDMGTHPFSELDERSKRDIRALVEVRPRIAFLDRVYFLRGPVLREISHVITSMIFEVLRNYGYDNIQGIKNDLLRRIGEMCPGRIDLEDMPIVDGKTAKQLELEHNSIDPDFIKKIVDDNRPESAKKIMDDNRPVSTAPGRRILVSSKLISKYKIMPTHLNAETRQKIHEILNEFDDLQNDDLKITYMQKLNDFSKRFDLYKDSEFLDFLERQIKHGIDKHIVLECLYTLHSLILTSKVENGDSFLAYVNEHYFTFLKEKSQSGNETYEYSLFKIEQIFKEIEKLISIEEMCEMYWKRMVRIIEENDLSGNRLGNCIDAFNENKCHLKPEWRKWLTEKDGYSDIKNQVLKEIHHLSLL